MKTDILKDAIAEADVIKKLAIDNAKASLNEAFDSKIKSMLAAKLQEEADGDDDLEEKYDDEESKDEAKKEDMNDDETDESFDIDAILAEMESEDDDDAMKEARKKGDDMENDEDEVEDDEEGMKEAKKEDMGMEDDEDDMKKDDVDEEIDLDALIAEMVGEGDYSEDDKEDEESEEGEETMMKEEDGDPDAEMLAKFKKFLKSQRKPEAPKEMPKKESIELQEIKRQAAELAKKVNETNLINAKLLYLNKVLRNHNLSENQKLKVVAAFDRATSVKEAKIVYESLNEALNIKVGATKTSLKESLGFASKASGNSTKREIISEADSHVARWQHLAGIKKSN